MKRWFSGFLAALLIASLAGCGLPAADLESGLEDADSSEEEIVSLPAEEPAEPEEEPGPAGPEDAEAPPEESGEGEAAGHAADPGLPDGPVSTWCQSDLEECWVSEDGSYTSKEDVACYIHFYDRLPNNFITKKEAQSLGWPGGSLEPYAPGKCIGGSRFGNYEGLLPEAEGRTYTECDIDTLGAKSRGAKRIVFSNDGLIYYTGDHYESFELLYGDEGDG